MRARVKLAEEYFIHFNTESIEVRCSECQNWVKLEELIYLPGTIAGQKYGCPVCKSINTMEESKPETFRQTQFELTPQEAVEKITRICKQLNLSDRKQVMEALRNA